MYTQGEYSLFQEVNAYTDLEIMIFIVAFNRNIIIHVYIIFIYFKYHYIIILCLSVIPPMDSQTTTHVLISIVRIGIKTCAKYSALIIFNVFIRRTNK